ncbi:hypothetical protein GF345_02375 [Candidatus Woesearchaeota archaeon]|nr:hypothetical protein [Candidatus Woesearchaeota archaeon]
MEEVVKKDILTVLQETIILIKDEEYAEIKELSNHTIHNASIFQDPDSVSIAVIVYAISKIMERTVDKRRIIGKKFSAILQDAITLLEKDMISEFRKAVKNLLKTISEHDERLHFFIEEVVKQARIKKGSKLFEHGISSAQAAQILGISQWELMDYLGKTTLGDEVPIDIKERLSFARRLFSKKKT